MDFRNHEERIKISLIFLYIIIIELNFCVLVLLVFVFFYIFYSCAHFNKEDFFINTYFIIHLYFILTYHITQILSGTSFNANKLYVSLVIN